MSIDLRGRSVSFYDDISSFPTVGSLRTLYVDRGSMQIYAWDGTSYELIDNGGGGGSSITVVANYAALPNATTVTGQFYWCSSSQGTKWLPGSLGGTYYPNGLYYSNGVSWEFVISPYQATQAEVDAGINDDKFVTPKTFNDSSQLSDKVPYTGATANVDLGTFHLDAAKGTFTHNGSINTLTANHTSGSGIGLLITKGGNNEGLKVNKTSGSGNAATIVGTLEATTLVKTGGTSTQFLMADGTISTGLQSINLNGQPNAINAGTSGATRYFGFSDNNNTTNELIRRTFLPNACTLKNFYVRTAGTQPASGSHVLTILKNGVATAITVTIPAGSGAGIVSDTTNSESFAAGDEISIKAVNNATGNSSTLVSFAIGNL
jgi:hypothetical protein